MSKRDDLIRLRDAVQVGWPQCADTPYMTPFYEAFGIGWIAKTAWDANCGSLDAALWLHNMVLPGWPYDISNAGAWTDERRGLRRPGYSGQSNTPARAWLLAILNALIAQEVE